MKTAIEIPGRPPGTAKFSDLLKSLPDPKKWLFGNVDLTGRGIPDWVNEGFEETLIRLNQIGPNKYELKSDSREKSLLFGRGSVGTHEDSVYGLSILTFLGSFIPGEDDEWNLDNNCNIPDFHHQDGQFFQGKFIEMTTGDSVLFDDRETHAWISNAYWVFASIPVRKLSKSRSKAIK